jgi:hypothetical protein
MDPTWMQSSPRAGRATPFAHDWSILEALNLSLSSRRVVVRQVQLVTLRSHAGENNGLVADVDCLRLLRSIASRFAATLSHPVANSSNACLSAGFVSVAARRL